MVDCKMNEAFTDPICGKKSYKLHHLEFRFLMNYSESSLCYL